MSFGYSVGDVISGANLTYRLIRIMADTKGGSVEYLEAMSELSAMQQAFLQVSNIMSHKLLPVSTVNAASHIILSSIDAITKFFERTKHYQRILGDSRASTFESSWCKVGWTLYKSHELHELRNALHAKLACTPLPATISQHQVRHENAAPSSPAPEEEDPIKFKDAVGRKFSFPWHICNTWQGMEDLIKQAFIQVDVLGPHVMEGHYDLLGPDSEIILPSTWEKVVKPGMAITMTMWPMDKIPSPTPPRHVPANSLEPQPLLPSGWEIKSDASGRPYLVDHNTEISHGSSPVDDNHQSLRTPATPSIPSASQSTVPYQVPRPQREAETDIYYQESHHCHHHSSDARSEIPPNERPRPEEELSIRIKELDTITQPAVIEIVNAMKESSRITRAQSKTITKAVKTMSPDSFEDAISMFQARMSCSQENSGRDSSLRNAEGQVLFGDIFGNCKEYKEEFDDDSGISVEGQDYDSDGLLLSCCLKGS